MKIYGNGSYADCFKMGPQKNLLRTLVGIFLQAWQQLTGINFILIMEQLLLNLLEFLNLF